jgi:hypothetical protein
MASRSCHFVHIYILFSRLYTRSYIEHSESISTVGDHDRGGVRVGNRGARKVAKFQNLEKPMGVFIINYCLMYWASPTICPYTKPYF